MAAKEATRVIAGDVDRVADRTTAFAADFCVMPRLEAAAAFLSLFVGRLGYAELFAQGLCDLARVAHARLARSRAVLIRFRRIERSCERSVPRCRFGACLGVERSSSASMDESRMSTLFARVRHSSTPFLRKLLTVPRLS